MPMCTSRRHVRAEARAVARARGARISMAAFTAARGASSIASGNAEERHHAVAEMLLDRAAVLARDPSRSLQAADHDRVGALRSGALGERGEAGDVCEEDGRPAAFSLDWNAACVGGARARRAAPAREGGENQAGGMASRACEDQLACVRGQAFAGHGVDEAHALLGGERPQSDLVEPRGLREAAPEIVENPGGLGTEREEKSTAAWLRRATMAGSSSREARSARWRSSSTTAHGRAVALAERRATMRSAAGADGRSSTVPISASQAVARSARSSPGLRLGSRARAGVDDRDPRRGRERRGLGEQSRLAGTLVAGEDHDAAVPLGETLETLAEQGARSRSRPTNATFVGRPPPAPRPKRRSREPDELEHREIGGLSLQLHAPELAVLEGVAGLCTRLGPDVDPTLRRLRLQTRARRSPRRPARGTPGSRCCECPRHHGAGVDADLEVERHGEGEAANVLPSSGLASRPRRSPLRVRHRGRSPGSRRRPRGSRRGTCRPSRRTAERSRRGFPAHQ